MKRIDPRIRFWLKVDCFTESGCWEWRAGRGTGGYGKFNTGGNRGPHVSAHRFAYEQLVGPVPKGLVLDHLCRNRICVNPAHLEPVTDRENVLRGVGITAVNAAKTHCPYGHEYDVVWRGRRTCKTCHNKQTAEGQRRRRARSAA